jgi:hypothetical protein
MRGLTEEKRLKMAAVVSAYIAGGTCDSVAKQFGISAMTVWYWLKRFGVKTVSAAERMKGRRWTETRRAHNPEKPKRPEGDPRGYDIMTARSIGNKSKTSHGYIRVNIGRKARQYEHILVAEKSLGRKLKRGEVVHHINCEKTDNRSENLLICTISYHRQLHKRMRAHPYWMQFKDQRKED